MNTGENRALDGLGSLAFCRAGWLALMMLWVAGLAGCERREPAAGGARTGAPAGAPAVVPAAAAGVVELTMTYGSEKKAWIANVTESFNNSNTMVKVGEGAPMRVHVTALPMGSGEAIDEIIEGHRQADLCSPASGAFIKLGNARSRAKTGEDLIGPTDNLVLSPVVIAMWKPMAQAMGWPDKPIGWSDILAQSQDPKGWGGVGHPEWGKFKLGHTHPEYSNSGLISALAIAYAATGKVNGLKLEDLTNAQTVKFMSQIESSVQHYGSSTGFFADKLVANGPGYLSAAVLYESSVIESYEPGKNKTGLPLVAIYPKEGTFWSDHPVGVVQRPWVTQEKKKAAKAYIDYLLAKPQQEAALKFGFRPADPEVALTEPISAQFGVNPKEPATTLEVPAPDVMDGVIQLWRKTKKKANIVLVFDVSGSMNEDNRLVNARDGAKQLVNMLGDEDQLSLVPFSDDTRWVTRQEPLKTGRAPAMNLLGGLIADGGTRLYDSIDSANSFILSQKDSDKIWAIVVLTDGDDNKSKLKLTELLERLKPNSEAKTIRVFTIGYGSGAKADVLKQIADVTRAKFYAGTTQNIHEVFKDIATFF
jgi:Ca-activated chloride channel homolog